MGTLPGILLGGIALAVLWYWLQYVAWGGVRWNRRAAWLRPATMRRVLRAARRKDRALDREIRTVLRSPPSPRTAGETEEGPGARPPPRPAHRRPGNPPE
jgi:hypothetical protein